MYDNPTGLIAARRLNGGGFGPWGATIWEALCNVPHAPFTLAEVTDEFYNLAQGTIARETATRYVRSFIAYMRAAPDEFRGPGTKLTRVGGRWYRLEDNPE